MNGKMMTLTYFKLYAVDVKKFFFHIYLLTYLNKDRQNLLKVINI